MARGILLYRQHRLDLAIGEFRDALADDPGDAAAHAWLAICLVDQQDDPEATAQAREGVHIAPDLAFAHYALAYVLERRGLIREAKAACDECIGLDPENAEYQARMASIQLWRRDWQAMLDTAERGLQIDPEHQECARLRAVALLYLGRTDESAATVYSALSHDPENALLHSNAGWSMLYRGEAWPALEHFGEALRLDPRQWHAQAGILEALKARNPVYRCGLRFFLWLGTLGQNALGLVLIGMLLISLTLVFVTGSFSNMPRFMTLMLMPNVLFAMALWSGEPLFNLMLCFDAAGRRILSLTQIINTVLVAVCLAIAAASFGTYLVTGNIRAAVLALISATMTVPISGVCKLAPGGARRRMSIYAALLLAVGWVAVVAAGYWADAPREYEPFFGISLSAYGIAWWLFGISARRLMVAHLRRR